MVMARNDPDAFNPRWVALAIGLGLLGVVVAAVSSPANSGPILGIGSLVAVATLALGCFLGFLFGVPRTRANDSEAVQANTNIEAISDWLTKILVGATLVELKSLATTFAEVSRSVAAEIGTGVATALPASIMVYFVVVGFLGGWLLTRLYLARALVDASRRLHDLDEQETAAMQRGDLAEVERVNAARAKIERAVAGRIDEIRANLKPGAARTKILEGALAQARERAHEEHWTAQSVRETYEAAGPGGRIEALGLMQGNDALVDADLVVRSVAESRSAFEQYHALVVAKHALDRFSSSAKEQLASAIKRQEEPGGYLVAGTDRHALAQAILVDLGRA